MRVPFLCPLCQGALQVARVLYESDPDPYDDTLEECVPCRTCKGTGVVWDGEPGGEHTVRIAGTLVVEGDVVATGFRTLKTSHEVACIDLVAGEGPGPVYATKPDGPDNQLGLFEDS